jgi:hypothetical protein
LSENDPIDGFGPISGLFETAQRQQSGDRIPAITVSGLSLATQPFRSILRPGHSGSRFKTETSIPKPSGG